MQGAETQSCKGDAEEDFPHFTDEETGAQYDPNFNLEPLGPMSVGFPVLFAEPIT